MCILIMVYNTVYIYDTYLDAGCPYTRSRHMCTPLCLLHILVTPPVRSIHMQHEKTMANDIFNYNGHEQRNGVGGIHCVLVLHTLSRDNDDLVKIRRTSAQHNGKWWMKNGLVVYRVARRRGVGARRMEHTNEHTALAR